MDAKLVQLHQPVLLHQLLVHNAMVDGSLMQQKPFVNNALRLDVQHVQTQLLVLLLPMVIF
jgi:hypothetical protein